MSSSRRWWLVGAVLLVVIAAGAFALTRPDDTVATPGPTAAPSTSAAPSPSATAEPDPVVLAVSVDGLNPEALRELGPEQLPTFWRLIDDGASTLNARTSSELTITLPNHTGMMTGRPVAGADGTSVTFNDDNLSTLEDVHGSYVASMFDVAHDSGVPTALFAEKDKFRFLVRSWDGRQGAPDRTGADDGRDKIDVADIAPSDTLVDEVSSTLSGGDARLAFWHIAAPDAAGHANGWLGEEYLDAVRDVDDQLAEVVDTIESDPALRDVTTVVLTADHGGARGAVQHSRADLAANHTVPFIAWGRGVEQGADLYDLDGSRRDPAGGRPDYSGPQPVRNLDVADTALDLLGIERTPRGVDEVPRPVRLD